MDRIMPLAFLLFTALLAGCSGADPAADAEAADGADVAPAVTLPADVPPTDPAPATFGIPSTQQFEQTWTAQAGQGDGAVYALRSAEPVVDMPLDATDFLVEVRWSADQALPGEARLRVIGPQGDWGSTQGAADLRLALPGDVGGHHGALRLELLQQGSAAVGMRATFYLTSFHGGPADPVFTALA